jgi:hypothetical protein
MYGALLTQNSGGKNLHSDAVPTPKALFTQKNAKDNTPSVRPVLMQQKHSNLPDLFSAFPPLGEQSKLEKSVQEKLELEGRNMEDIKNRSDQTFEDACNLM